MYVCRYCGHSDQNNYCSRCGARMAVPFVPDSATNMDRNNFITQFPYTPAPNRQGVYAFLSNNWR